VVVHIGLAILQAVVIGVWLVLRVQDFSIREHRRDNCRVVALAFMRAEPHRV
jgi:uncharacterized integral membrane protein